MKWELVNFCEVDKFSVKSYCAIHDVSEDKNLGNIENVDFKNISGITMICGGSPCQDFSIAGKQKGSVWTCKKCRYTYNPLIVNYKSRDLCPICKSDKIIKTRSSLLVEYLRAVRETHPIFGIYENVKNITGKRNKVAFDLFLQELKSYGYNTYWKVLNAKDYGVPQNRERVYVIYIDKNIDNGKFKCPEKIKLTDTLENYLEDIVDKKYYISVDKIKKY